jgi:16S rRNA (guanine527-N7)-methyltransferase
MARRGEVDWDALAHWSSVSAGCVLTAAQLDQLRVYLDTLQLWNRKLALVSQREAGQIIDKHIADSLFAAGRCGSVDALIDLGSGAGFPALPIAIAHPNTRVALVEARGKKASFLEEACRAAAIRNAQVHHARIEAVAGDVEHRGRYDVVTARALTSLSEFLAMAGPFLRPGGRAVAMRSVGEPRESEPAGAKEIIYQLPDGTPRRLVVVPI